MRQRNLSTVPARRAHAAVILAYLTLAIIMTYPLVVQMGYALPDIGEDGWKTYWNFWWVRRALLDLQVSPLHTPLIYAPTGSDLYFDQLALSNDLIMLPVQLVLGLFPAYNLAILLWFTLSGYAGYLLSRYTLRGILPATNWRTGRAHFAAFTGGLIFAFAPTQFGRVVGGGQMLMAVQWLALFVLFTSMAIITRAPAAATIVLAGLCFAMSALTDWYQPLWETLWLAIFVPWRIWQSRREPRRAALIAVRVSAIGAIGVAFLSPVLAGMISSLLTWGSASYTAPTDQFVSSSADLLAFFTPPEKHPLWGRLIAPLASRFTESYFEHTVFIGYVALLLVFVGARRFFQAVRFWLLTALAFCVYILGPVLHVAGESVWYPMPLEMFLVGVPALAGFARSVSRGDTMVMLGLSVAAAFGMYALAEHRLLCILPGLVVMEYLWIPFPTTTLQAPAYYQRLAREGGDFAIMRLPMEWNRRDDLAFQTVHGKAMTTGFTSRDDPVTLVKRVPVLQNFRNRGFDIITQDMHTVAPTVLHDLGVRYIVVDYGQMPPPSDELYYWEDHRAELVGDSAPVYRDDRVEVFAAPPFATAVPYLRLETGWGALDPENWGTVQAEGWRPMASRAGLTIVSADAREVRLTFKAKSVSPRSLVLVQDGRELAQFALTDTARRFGANIIARTGETRLEFQASGSTFETRVTGIDLE